MAVSNRKSFGAVRFDMIESSPSTMSPSRRRRSIAAPRAVTSIIEENDDEAERLARRERNDAGSPASVTGSDTRRQSVFGLSGLSNISTNDMNNQIAQCIKLSAENKISDKNAFQLKMIDFLLYTLKKQDPNMTNLQMASASLDASAKIYGFRVDKVYSDLLKIIGTTKQDKRQQDENGDNVDPNEEDASRNQIRQKKKKKKNIISTVEALKGTIETYDPLSLIRCQADTQTSDMLFQAGLPQHANQGVALNLYNDVILDKIAADTHKSSKLLIPVIDDFKNQDICSSYAAFQFLGWSPDDEPEMEKSQTEDNDGEYHFDLEAEIADDNVIEDDGMMDCSDAFEERCGRSIHNNQNFENIIDFQDIIANNPNPNATYEYSYIQTNHCIQWAGPSHWKITLNRNHSGSRVVETCKQNITKKRKEIELIFTTDSKGDCEKKFSQVDKQVKLVSKTTKQTWSKDKVTFPKDVHYDLKRYYTFFNKPKEHIGFFDNEKGLEAGNNENDHDYDTSNFDAMDEGEYLGDHNEEERITQDQDVASIEPFSRDTAMTQTQGALIGDNLVSVPRLIDKIFIPYSQRAKKIDMRQLKKCMWKQLKKALNETEKENFDITQAVRNENNKEIEPKSFSSIYLKVPKYLPKLNADSLSPAIAFVSLLHLAHENNLKLDRSSEFADLNVKNEKNASSIV